MEISQLSRPLRKWLTTNLATSSFTAKAPTTTEPTNDGVIDLAQGGGIIPQWLFFMPYGLGSSNDGFSARIIAWRKVKNATFTLWVPFTLGEFACLLSTSVGVAGAPVLDTEAFCDTITAVALSLPDRKIAAGTSINSDVRISSPANDTPGFVCMPLYAVDKIEFLGDQTTNTPTMNALAGVF